MEGRRFFIWSLSKFAFKNWKLTFQKQVAGAHPFPAFAFNWICQVDEVTEIKQLEDDGTQRFSRLNIKIAAGLMKICVGEFKDRLRVHEMRLQRRGKMLNGRQIALLIYQEFR